MVKRAHVKEVHGALAWAQMYGAPYWDLNQVIRDLEGDLFLTPERKDYMDIVEMSKADSVVATHLTEAFNRYFLGI